MKIYDAIHGFIHFNEIESTLIDSFPFQRLHNIHQLGIAYLVYPGATHSRFEHSIGVMQLATRIFDGMTQAFPLPENAEYWRQQMRLAALCHDLGHLPFSHVAEKALLGAHGHEKWTIEVIQSHYFHPVWQRLLIDYPEAQLEDLIKLSIGEEKLKQMGIHYTFTAWESVLSEIITGDFFGADRIDYLVRDAKMSGVSYGLIDYEQLIESLRVLPYENRLALGIEENGIESCEALLLARHFMHRRVYQYATAKAYSFHLMRFMKAFYAKRGELDLESYLWTTDHEILTAVAESVKKGDKDAIALFKRHERFKAIQIERSVRKEDIEQIQKSLAIPHEAISWEFSHQTKKKLGCSFPLLKRDGQVVDGATYSEVTIPPGPAGWVFISREYYPQFSDMLY